MSFYTYDDIKNKVVKVPLRPKEPEMPVNPGFLNSKKKHKTTISEQEFKKVALQEKKLLTEQSLDE